MKLLLGLILVSLLLVAGCAGEKQAPAEPTPPVEVPETPTEVPVTPETPPEVPPVAPEVPTEPAPKLDTWNITTFMMENQSIHCVVNYVENPYMSEGVYPGDSELWVDGEKMRFATGSISGADTWTTIYIISGDMVYLTSTEGNFSPPISAAEECDWASFNLVLLTNCTASILDKAAPDTEFFNFEAALSEPPTNFTCEYEDFGPEIFVPTGKLCDLTEKFCNIYVGIYNGSGIPAGTPEEVCGDLQGELKAQCMEEFAD